MNILIAGGSGFVGTHLCRALLRRGDEVRIIDIYPPQLENLPSHARENLEFIHSDLQRDTFDHYWLDGIDAVVHLAGAPLLRSWSRGYRRLMYDSRIEPAKHLVSTLKSCSVRPCVLVSASSVGIYDPQNGDNLTESSASGNGFFADLCKHWERESDIASDLGVRVVLMRTAPVIGDTRQLDKIRSTIQDASKKSKLLAQQHLSWIHVDDLVNVYLNAIDDDMLCGPVNASSHEHVSAVDFINVFSHIAGRTKVTEFLPRAIRFQNPSIETTFQIAQSVLPLKLSNIGFRYRFPHLKDALEDVLGDSLDF